MPLGERAYSGLLQRVVSRSRHGGGRRSCSRRRRATFEELSTGFPHQRLHYNDLSGSASRPRLNLKVHLLQVAATLSPPALPSGLKQHSKPQVQGLEIVVVSGAARCRVQVIASASCRCGSLQVAPAQRTVCSFELSDMPTNESKKQQLVPAGS